jgi:nucleoside phosphorylase/Flp pilus assembly protein TadD
MIQTYAPPILILLGIAAGRRGKLKIGDVIVPREVADFSVRVLEGGEEKQRPRILPLNHAVLQMIQAFRCDRAKFLATFKKLFGPPITPNKNQQEEFAQHVTFEPAIHDNALASMDALLRDKVKFEELCKTHQGIRASEMEAGGFIKACEGRYPPKPWLVIRGISDLGDDLKNDDFHRLASCAAASFLDLFLTDGLDLEIFGGAVQRTKPIQTPVVDTIQTVQVSQPTDGSAETRFSALTANIINQQLEKLSESLSDAALKRIESIRELWRTGDAQEAFRQLLEMKQDAGWKILKPEARFRILRLEASFQLSVEGNPEQSKVVLQEVSKEGNPQQLKGLEALIAFHEGAHEKALEMLKDPQNLETWNLRLAILREIGRWATAIKEYEKPPAGISPDAESKRVYALSLLHGNNIDGALRLINEAMASQPRWIAVRLASAIISYFSSLSPALLRGTPKQWPAPCDTGLVKRDRETLERLRVSDETLSSLLTNGSLQADIKVELEGWKLACLANDAERQSEAGTYCAELLEKNPSHPIAVHWAIARNYVTDVSPSIEALAAGV